MIFDVERFSAEDGPGIRTVVFLKGCKLRCPWCHNPEGISFQRQLGYSAQKCTGCGACVEICPVGAQIFQNGRHVLDRTRCQSCFRCTEVCYSGALECVGKDLPPEQLLEQILEDEVFFRRSNGGVTFSGGEPMCQPDYLLRMLRMLKERGIHTAIETNLAEPWENYERVLPYLDLVMADIKSLDMDKLKEWTGSSNILETADRLLHGNVPVIVRTPVIPGFNDQEKDVNSIAKFLSGKPGLLYYELLPYHPLGKNKDAFLGRRGQSFAVPSSEKMNQLEIAAKSCGVQLRRRTV